MSTHSKLSITVIAAFMSVSSAWAADLRVSRYFSDNMVLQREKPVNVWGSADAGDKVTVSFAEQSKSATADKDGRWMVTLDAMPANAKGQSLTVQSPLAPRPLTLSNVVVGDVWFFGRQTYVDISLGRNDEGKAAAVAYKPAGTFRAIVIKTVPTKVQQTDLDKEATSGWVNVDGNNALGMSAAAFYLGKDLAKTLDVPVGIVDVNMDRYFAMGWLSQKAIADALLLYPDDKEISWFPGSLVERAEARDSGKAQKELDEYYATKMKGQGLKPSLGLHPLKNPSYPSAGYNAVIHPLRHLVMKGILLQLGNDYPFIAYRDLDKNGKATDKAELNAAWQENYVILKNGYRITEVTLPYVPGDWRRTFNDKSLPIGLILPPSSALDVYAAHNMEIRELHRRTAERQGGMGLIMPGNENIPLSGQPADDHLLAERCKAWMLGAVEGRQGVTATGPMFDRLESTHSRATVYFKAGTADGLQTTGDALDLFETAGPDLKWEKSTASIDGATIKLKSEGAIQFARFNWNSKPAQTLVNAAGLPALPFNNEASWRFGWYPTEEKPELPMEYHTTANQWGDSEVAIINGQIANLASGDSEPIPSRLGPLGIIASPFGPNIYVTSADPGTPADGKVQPGDLIYGINGRIFDEGPDVPGDAPYRVLSEAITYSESEKGNGRMVLSLRRGKNLMDVELQLPVLGSYSASTPYYCEKSANIVKNAEAWFSKRYRPESGRPDEPRGFLSTDVLFMLAAGTPEHQGLVRRAVYKSMAGMDPKPVTPGMQSKPWHTGYESILLGEYFNATGDRNVLPYLKYLADLSAESQIKPKEETPPNKEFARYEDNIGGWRQNYPVGPRPIENGYGLMAHAGMSCTMGMQLAKEAGVEIDELALKRGLEHFNKGRAEFAFVLYWSTNLRIPGPKPINPAVEAAGMMGSDNGKLGTAAALFNLVNLNDTVEICSRYCVYSYSNTRSGHGGMWFNNFWTPIGAWAAGEQGFKHFMKGQTWWRELYRKSDGSFNQTGRGGIGVSYGIPYVAPRKRLRILGAPVSAFGTNCPAFLKPALEAHQNRDYAKCEALIRKEMGGIIPAGDMPIVNNMLESVQILQASIEHDLTFTEKLIKDGKAYYASLELPQLKGVVSGNDARLMGILASLESPEGMARIQADMAAIETAQQNVKRQASKDRPDSEQGKWSNLIPSNNWQMNVVEGVGQAPAGWTDPEFDDSGWNTATLPIPWAMYHTALFRGKFNVDDKTAIDGLRIVGRFFQQQNVLVYLNGELVAKIDEIDKGGGTVTGELNAFGMKQLKNGENTICIATRHKRRWGSYRGTYVTSESVGFSIEGLKK